MKRIMHKYSLTLKYFGHSPNNVFFKLTEALLYRFTNASFHKG